MSQPETTPARYLAPEHVSLAWDCRLATVGDTVEVHHADVVVSLRGADTASTRRMIDLLDGRHSAESLARGSGLSVAACAELGALLVEQGVADRAPPATAPTMTGEQFAAACRRRIAGWKERVFAGILWRLLNEGTASPAVFAGWLLENFHFIEGATSRLSAAAGYCPDPNIRRHFTRHFTEEYDHCGFFRDALLAIGLTDDDIDHSRPLPGTLAIIHHMRCAARTDPLAYAACSAFLEASGADRDHAAIFYARLGSRYDRVAVDLMAKHAALDEDYGHVGFLEKVCAEVREIGWERADRALQFLYGLVETLELWAATVYRHYESGNGKPRSARLYGTVAPNLREV